jgi:hypothetical protein
MCWTSKH